MNKPDFDTAKVCFEDASEVKKTNTATYLGITCNSKATQLTNLTQRLGKASDTFNKLQLFWRHINISNKMKLRFFKQIFYPMVLYGLEYSTITHHMENKLDAWQARHIRRVLDIKASMISHITNQEVLTRAVQAPLSAHVYSRQLKYLGHVLRRDTNNTEYSVCFTSAGNHANIRGKRRVGRPKYHWAPSLMESISKRRPTSNTDQMHALIPSSTSLLRPFRDLAGSACWKSLVAAPTRITTRIGHTRTG